MRACAIYLTGFLSACFAVVSVAWWALGWAVSAAFLLALSLVLWWIMLDKARMWGKDERYD